MKAQGYKFPANPLVVVILPLISTVEDQVKYLGESKASNREISDGKGDYTLLYGSLESLTGDNLGRCAPWSFNKIILYLQVSHTARLSPSKNSSPTTVPNVLTFLRIPQPYFPPKKQTHAICNNRPHIVDPSYRGRTKVAFWFGVKARKGGCTVISRSFPRSVDIFAWSVQR